MTSSHSWRYLFKSDMLALLQAVFIVLLFHQAVYNFIYMTEITSVISWVKYISCDLRNSLIWDAAEMVQTDNCIIAALFLKSLILFLNMAQIMCHTNWTVSVSKCANEIIHCPDTFTQWLQPNFSLHVSLSCHCQPHSGTWKKARTEFSQRWSELQSR